MPDLADLPESPDPLASPPARCPECGYAMAGLPPVGQCPECGWGYDDQIIVLFGRGTSVREAVANTSTRDTVITLCMLLAFTGIMTWGLVGSSQWLVLMAVWAIVLLIGGGLLYARRAKLEPVEQLRLSAAGFGGRRGFGKVRFEPWGPDVDVVISHRTPAAWQASAGVGVMRAAVQVRRPTRPGRVTIAGPPGGSLSFDADWPTLDRLARRVIGWRDGAETLP